mgnify:CR=1 FL=1
MIKEIIKKIVGKFDFKNKKILKECVVMKNEVSSYTNRELSWLQFNERVLNEAGNPEVPLAERLSFISIFQTNLDEFFMVRVGTLLMQMQSSEKIVENKTYMTSKEQVKAILKETKRLENKKGKIYEQLMGELEPKGIRIINFNKLSQEEGAMLEEYFDTHIAPFLSPMIIGKQQPFPFLANKQLYAIVLLSTSKGKKKIGLVPCSNGVFKRLIEIPTRPGNFMLSEELILHFISKLYSKYTVAEKSILRITRNADIDASEIYDEDLDYRDMMEQMIKKRTRLDAVRIELSRNMDDKIKKELSHFTNIGSEYILDVKTPLDLSFVFSLQAYLKEQTELFYEKHTPRRSPALDLKRSIFEQIEEKDVLLSYPYESMKPFIQLLQEAADDDSVVSIKMTLYRVAERSKIIDTLIEAAENGKEVVVTVELRARFDEANNIEMSHRLEEAGCQILYGLGNYKVHSKLCLITRKTEDGFSYITQIGTGNYNEKTSALYTDLSLITANQEIGKEAAEVFAALLKGEVVEKSNLLLVAPKCLQNRVLDMIQEEIDQVKQGKEGYIGIKINSLTDKVIINKLVEASQAGVKIEMVVRGICCLIPEIKGYTENIKVVSIVGRYLEHSRIYRFGTKEREKIYIASADFMTRNTVRRVEVAAPVLNEKLKERLDWMFETMMNDDEKGKRLTETGNYADRSLNDVKLNSQEIFYAMAYSNAEKTQKKRED